tara:strand:+ start:28642 stop:29076 length:435 start_codon:yes stop_codon:yes gene_type:complete
MSKIPQIAIILFALTTQAQQDFSKYKWRNRILLFTTTSLDNEDFKKQWESFLDKPKKLEDRNLLLFVLCKGRIYDHELKPVSHFDVAALRKLYGLPANHEEVVLIGKDGGSKFKKSYVFDSALVFENIDKMPMRQREMRENIDD